MRINALFLLVWFFVALVSTGCTTSVIIKENPYFSDGADYAIVYLVRPMPRRPQGVADNDLIIEFGENQLVSRLSSGEYVAFKVKPGAIDVITRNETYLTAKPMPEQVWRSRNFTFEKGNTYFVEPVLTQEEFRGIYFVPKLIDLAKAKDYLKQMKPAGDLAKSQPISSL